MRVLAWATCFGVGAIAASGVVPPPCPVNLAGRVRGFAEASRATWLGRISFRFWRENPCSRAPLCACSTWAAFAAAKSAPITAASPFRLPRRVWRA